MIGSLLPPPKSGGRPRKTNLRRVCDAIFYLLKTGCQWRFIPGDFPPWRTVYEYFMAWQADGTLRKIQRKLFGKVRRSEGKKLYPTIAIVDSQTIKTGRTVSREKNYDGAKRLVGRKRHVAVDILGLPISILVTHAKVSDIEGGRRVLRLASRFLKGRRLKKVYADGAYRGERFRNFALEAVGAVVSIKKGVHQKAKKFVPIQKRWVVERTFGWFNGYRRLDKDQERLTKNSVAMVRWSCVSLMLNRLKPNPNTVAWPPRPPKAV